MGAQLSLNIANAFILKIASNLMWHHPVQCNADVTVRTWECSVAAGVKTKLRV